MVICLNIHGPVIRYYHICVFVLDKEHPDYLHHVEDILSITESAFALSVINQTVRILSISGTELATFGHCRSRRLVLVFLCMRYTHDDHNFLVEGRNCYNPGQRKAELSNLEWYYYRKIRSSMNQHKLISLTVLNVFVILKLSHPNSSYLTVSCSRLSVRNYLTWLNTMYPILID